MSDYWFRLKSRKIDRYQYSIHLTIGSKSFIKTYLLMRKDLSYSGGRYHQISSTMTRTKAEIWSDEFGLRIPKNPSSVS